MEGRFISLGTRLGKKKVGNRMRRRQAALGHLRSSSGDRPPFRIAKKAGGARASDCLCQWMERNGLP